MSKNENNLLIQKVEVDIILLLCVVDTQLICVVIDRFSSGDHLDIAAKTISKRIHTIKGKQKRF